MSAPIQNEQMAQSRMAYWIAAMQAVKMWNPGDQPREPVTFNIAVERELYVSGKISLDDFEARLDAIFSRAAA